MHAERLRLGASRPDGVVCAGAISAAQTPGRLGRVRQDMWVCILPMAWAIIAILVVDVQLPASLRGRASGARPGRLPRRRVDGARQTGKSTLARTEPFLADRLYLTLDDPETHERARLAARDLVRSAPRLTLDEVQREPDLLLAVKRAVDEDRPRRNGRFLLTGSANLLLMERVSETLAGGRRTLNLWPLCRRERLGRGTPGIWSDLLGDPRCRLAGLLRVARRGARRLADRGSRQRLPNAGGGSRRRRGRSLWFDGYVRTYLERDLQSLAAVGNLVDFRRLMRVASLGWAA